ncbi:MAG: DUF72 domain-containing protein [Candidatus Jordarchaeales archaeon]
MIKVGCCGYPVAMKKYHENLRLVELNVTFYRYPKLSTIDGWRIKAPTDFEFSVKAHRDITHKHRLKPQKQCLETFEKIKEICKALEARVLLIQTPASFKPDRLDNAKEFFTRVNREGLRLVWETRGPEWETPAARKGLASILRALDVVQVTDPLKTLPAYTSDVAYFRLHGLGERLYYYQYSDEELRTLETVARQFETEGKDVYVLFNNLSMFEDATRFLHYLKTRKFRSVTGAKGIESIKNVIGKTRYPVSKILLIKKVGWRVVELEDGETMRLQELLKNVPSSKMYDNVGQVLNDIKLRK